MYVKYVSLGGAEISFTSLEREKKIELSFPAMNGGKVMWQAEAQSARQHTDNNTNQQHQPTTSLQVREGLY
jgi:hypothetical protein